MTALDEADAMDIVANVLERWIVANTDLALAEIHAESARSATEAETADDERIGALVDIGIVESVIDDPLNLESFTGCEAWAARLARPEVYRRILMARIEGKSISEYAYDAAVATAQKAIRLDSELISGVTEMSRL
ncbi:MAG TPA: hypothetical protein VGS97_25085 [Actinocrinis sp.]|uniref:hypothetical protein n=1 Tax=Actinocrinis sp. TaxID=1920516 RepID=UPI002DDCF76D|nr:hypothetical protein [Actinocrinis sp.]HEV2347394.1 hypothetical protein [Actinocrinis sp.]